jgi:DNA-binding NtrC family response regulator
VIELACVMSEGEEINEEDIQINFKIIRTSPTKNGNYTLKEYTLKLIQQYLDEYDYDVLAVAGKLNVGKSTIYRMINSDQLKVIKKRSDA